MIQGIIESVFHKAFAHPQDSVTTDLKSLSHLLVGLLVAWRIAIKLE
jgi:hypothetical protein